MKTTSITLIVLLLWLVSATAVLAQDECQIPRFVVQGTGEGNVMILADNSGSMNEVVYHLDYDPSVSYPGRFWGSGTYYISHTGDYEPRDFNYTWESYPSIRMVDSDNGQQGRYTGNYLNWLFYHATEQQRNEAPQVTRVQVMKEVLCDVLGISSRLHFGLTIYQYDHGGSVVARCGANNNSIAATINGITANTWTPTGETMADIADYFEDDLPSAPIQSPCIKNFLIVMTDGYPTMDRDVPARFFDTDGDGNEPGSCASIGAPYSESNNCSDYMDDVAYYLANTDLRPDMPGDQIVNTYVIGYHVDAPLLQETADNGIGLYYTARNASELRYSLEWALQDIIRRISAGSAVAVVSTERGYDDRLFRGKFMPVDWDGYLESYALPYEEGDAPVWEAGSLLAMRSADDRHIFTAFGSNELWFNDGNAANLMLAMGCADLDTTARVINWARGEDVDGLRDRHGWKLGDIVHSTPVVVGAPSEFHLDPTYEVFRENHEFRRKTVYVGANDGMLHAFAADNGEELWGFVPESALPVFEAMADSFYCHRYTVDHTVHVRDVKLDGDWRTVLMGGEREGGAGFFALDVTNPYTPYVMWQDETPDGLPFPSEPVMIKAGGKYIAVMGSGFQEDDGEARLYAYDLQTGALEGELYLSYHNNDRNKATRPAAYDENLDGETDVLYVGDMTGKIHRIDLNNSYSPHLWDRETLFDGNAPITAPPILTTDEDGFVRVAVGTGSYLDEGDMDSAEDNYFLCVIDRNDGNTASLGSLVDQTDHIDEIGGHDGWYVELEMADNERITAPALAAAGNILVTSFAPSHDECIAGGESWLYRFYYANGGSPEEGEDGEEQPRVESLGDGIASHPVMDLVSGNVVIQSSDAELHIEEVGAMYSILNVRAWQESFDYVATESLPEED